MSDQLFEVFELLRTGPKSVLELYEIMGRPGLKRTAVNNRIKSLLDLEVIEKHRDQKRWLYEIGEKYAQYKVK